MATEADATLIADISRKTFHETFAPQNTRENMEIFMNTQFGKEKLMAELSDPENVFVLAYQGDELAGYLKLRDSANPEHLENSAAIEINRLYSISTIIGKGIGKILMATSLDIAQKRNKAIVWLGVWEKNQRAINFYTRWGFEKFGEHDFLLGNDVQRDWLMKKHLG